MDNQKDYSCLEHNGKVTSKHIEIEMDFQEALPAYCDDIYRVVKCAGRSFITSAEINYNEIKLCGKTEVCLTYFNENSSLCYVDFEENFVKTVSVEGLSDFAFVCADIFDKYTNYRVINQRRIDIHNSAVINLSVYDKISCPALCSCDNSKLRHESIKIADFVNSSISRIEFDESFTLPAGNEPIKRIISYSSFASLNEVKMIKDKALIKAVVSVNVLYTSDTNEENIEKAEYSFNVSKIIEAAGISDDDYAVSNISVGSLVVKAKSNGGERVNALDVFGELSISTVFISETDEDLITDGYIPNYNTNCTFNEYKVNTAGSFFNESKVINMSFGLPDGISKMYEVNIQTGNITLKNGKIIIDVLMNAVCENNSGELVGISSGEEIEFSAEGYNQALAALNINSYDYTLSDNTLDVRLNATLIMYLYNNKTIKLLSDINQEGEVSAMPTLTIYFGKQDESVWDIAKSFSSDTNMIIKENTLNGEILDSNRILIIPKV